MSITLRSGAPALALGLVAMTGLTGCGSSSETSDTSDVSTLAITVKGDKVSPENKRIPVSLKKGITLKITADRAGELHVHSSPEQEIEFQSGTTTKKLTFTVPGVIEVEEHKTDSLIAQLEVK